MAVVCELHGQVQVGWVEKTLLPSSEPQEALRDEATGIHSYSVAEMKWAAENI